MSNSKILGRRMFLNTVGISFSLLGFNFFKTQPNEKLSNESLLAQSKYPFYKYSVELPETKKWEDFLYEKAHEFNGVFSKAEIIFEHTVNKFVKSNKIVSAQHKLLGIKSETILIFRDQDCMTELFYSYSSACSEKLGVLPNQILKNLSARFPEVKFNELFS